MGDVIQGPWGENFFDFQPLTDSYITEQFATCILDELFDHMRELGFDNQGDVAYAKDLALIGETIRSYLHKLQEEYHPCQDVADALFQDDENGNIFVMNPSIDIVFRFDETNLEITEDEK